MSSIEEIFNLSSNDILASLKILNKLGAIKMLFGDKMVFGGSDIEIVVIPQTFRFLQEMEETKQNDYKRKWSNRRWSMLELIISAGITFVLGIISGFAIADHANYLNKQPLPAAIPTQNAVISPKTTINP
jgi:uncharacterized membrane protein YfcA